MNISLGTSLRKIGNLIEVVFKAIEETAQITPEKPNFSLAISEKIFEVDLLRQHNNHPTKFGELLQEFWGLSRVLPEPTFRRDHENYQMRV